ncbi:hypothetical protein ACLI08_01430 [Flavobacterium sp. RNTU_13]
MDDLLPLSDEQQKPIEISREKIRNSQFSMNGEVIKEMSKFIQKCITK